MSTNRDSVGAVGSGARKRYFCHQCEAIVDITIPLSSFDELVCPTCAGGFLEEYDENPNPNSQIPQPTDSSFSFSFTSSVPGFSFAFGDDGDDEPSFANPADLMAAMLGEEATGGLNQGPQGDAFNPMVFLQNYLNGMRPGGADIQFVFENGGLGGGGGGGEFGLPGNLGDYFVGPGLEQLIQQLAENDPNRYGTPPASKEAVQKLPDIKITDELMASDNAQCAVCMDAFELDGKAKQMPCKHIFHSDCILPWLELHNSCPVCRYELPTDDPEYENRGTSGPRGNSAGGNSDSSEDNSQARRVRVQLPWPFNSFGFGSEGNNSGSSHSNRGNSGGRSHQ